MTKDLGGLGVGNILHKNLILLFKWWWRYSESDYSLWKRILLSIHNIGGMKALTVSFNKVKAGIWSQMLSKDVDTSKIRTIVEEGMIMKVGSGASILFWHDGWCDSEPLSKLFPRLFVVSLQKNYFINQMGEWIKDAWSWNLRWRRGFLDWEVEEAVRLENRIAQKKPK